MRGQTIHIKPISPEDYAFLAAYHRCPAHEDKMRCPRLCFSLAKPFIIANKDELAGIFLPQKKWIRYIRVCETIPLSDAKQTFKESGGSPEFYRDIFVMSMALRQRVVVEYKSDWEEIWGKRTVHFKDDFTFLPTERGLSLLAFSVLRDNVPLYTFHPAISPPRKLNLGILPRDLSQNL